MVAKGEIRSDGEPVGPALAHSAYVTAHQHEAARMIRDPGARISIMATGATHAPIKQAEYMTATRSHSAVPHSCTRAGSIYDIKDGAVGEVLLTDCCVSFSKWSLAFGLRCGLV